eukprot:541997-Amphidinium_carterae.1
MRKSLRVNCNSSEGNACAYGCEMLRHVLHFDNAKADHTCVRHTAKLCMPMLKHLCISGDTSKLKIFWRAACLSASRCHLRPNNTVWSTCSIPPSYRPAMTDSVHQLHSSGSEPRNVDVKPTKLLLRLT